ncbi:MAG: hypothetical protein IIX19_00075 [Alistipes sp.]|nr:hypothetical protein [Alistipes sp.]
MSIFRPPKTKPRQFNYFPRYYDPVKEERNQRRKELHGTSTESDNEEYVPGKYVRTQREAREASRSERDNGGMTKLRGLIIVAAVIAVATMWLLPRIMNFVIAANEEKQAEISGKPAATAKAEEEINPTLDWVINESIDVENMEGIETLNDDVIKELEESEWRTKRIKIIPNE